MFDDFLRITMWLIKIGLVLFILIIKLIVNYINRQIIYGSVPKRQFFTRDILILMTLINIYCMLLFLSE